MRNLVTELKAIDLAVQYELQRLSLSDPSQIKRMQKGCGYDLESPDGRKIEVKGSLGIDPNSGFRLNTTQEILFAESNGYFYRITNLDGSPMLYIFRGNQLVLSKSEWASVRVPVSNLGEPIEL
ncbi:protein NO VEIN domain-containing protein [Comamonas terrigena]|uniref:protein NO VEIN domain-containing protein n=1 Tax=Comamonas terrigena TaxID=32013 RepID=UPI00289D0DBC|nr:DUF3883 domain-containing protein [Comamonas terrigena]